MTHQNEGGQQGSMLHYYHQYLVIYGEILTELERAGIKVDVDQLAKVTELAKTEREQTCTTFKQWASQFFEDAVHMNPSSPVQVQTLLFGVYEKTRRIAYERILKVSASEDE